MFYFVYICRMASTRPNSSEDCLFIMEIYQINISHVLLYYEYCKCKTFLFSCKAIWCTFNIIIKYNIIEVNFLNVPDCSISKLLIIIYQKSHCVNML